MCYFLDTSMGINMMKYVYFLLMRFFPYDLKLQAVENLLSNSRPVYNKGCGLGSLS